MTNDPTASSASSFARRLIPITAFAALVGVALLILWPFLASIAWAIIIAYATWPLYARLRGLFGERALPAALLTTTLVALTLLIPMLWLGWLARDEATALVSWLSHFVSQPPPMPDAIAGLPVIGAWLAEQWHQIIASPEVPLQQARAWLTGNLGNALALAGGLGRTLAKMVMTVIVLFFLYRDGELLTHQVREVLAHYLGAPAHGYVESAGDATRGVVFGFLLTAIIQGALAGLGYWFVGLPSPAILGLVTTLLALVPFGATLIWGAAALWLLVQGELWPAAALALWGSLVISQIDNVLRPMIISGTARIPFLPVLFGVLGGILAFGLIGLFLGPVILAVVLSVWREWTDNLENQPAGDQTQAPPPAR